MLTEGLRTRTVLLVAVVTTALSWLGGRWWLDQGEQPVQITWPAAVLLAGLAVAVLVIGRRMWRHRRREQVVEPLVAARILGLAQATALTGALAAGAYLGQALALVPDLDFAGRGGVALWHALAALAGSLAAAAGLVVQSWCRVVDDRDDPDHRDHRDRDPGVRGGGGYRDPRASRSAQSRGSPSRENFPALSPPGKKSGDTRKNWSSVSRP